MNIELNKEKYFTDKTKLNALLEELSISSKGIAVAINDEIILKNEWEHTLLNENDKITIIKATQGG